MTWTRSTPTEWVDFGHPPEWPEFESALRAAADRLHVDVGSVGFFRVTEAGKTSVGFYVLPD